MEPKEPSIIVIPSYSGASSPCIRQGLDWEALTPCDVVALELNFHLSREEINSMPQDKLKPYAEKYHQFAGKALSEDIPRKENAVLSAGRYSMRTGGLTNTIATVAAWIDVWRREPNPHKARAPALVGRYMGVLVQLGGTIE